MKTPHERGTFFWAGLATSDPPAAIRFYGRLFDWEAEELPTAQLGTCTVLRGNRDDVAILYRQTPEARAAGAAPHWTSFVAVHDADAATARAVEVGGGVVRAATDVADAGRVAALRDPTGAIFSVWQPRALGGTTGEPARATGPWHELRTQDPERALRFYSDLFAWQYAPDGSDRWTIVAAGRGVGSIREQAAHEPLLAGWVPWFVVESVDAVAVAATALGGRRLVPAAARGDRMALMADPQGAQFAVAEAQPKLAAGPVEKLR